MLCGIDSILWKIIYIKTKCEKYFDKYYQSYITLL